VGHIKEGPGDLRSLMLALLSIAFFTMKTVIIVGGGYGGIALAKALEKQISSKLGAQQVRVLLIDTKTHFYHSVGGLRAGVQNLDNRIFIPYTKLFKNPVNLVIHATVTHFDSHTVFLNSDVPDFGLEIKFDFLVGHPSFLSLSFFSPIFFFLINVGNRFWNTIPSTRQSRATTIRRRPATDAADPPAD
jgi:hypothetical protein